MTISIQQREELHRRIWQIANEVRGAIDGWDFKQYVLGALFYRFISENFSCHVGKINGKHYADLSDKEFIEHCRQVEIALEQNEITDKQDWIAFCQFVKTKKAEQLDIVTDLIKTKGFFIYPSQLFENVIKTAHQNDHLNVELRTIFNTIEGSAKGTDSENDITGLFEDFDTTSSKLGNTVKEKNERLFKVLQGVQQLNLGEFEDNQIDLFGDAYEFLISNYAANAGRSGGEFFTPQSVSKLLARLALQGQETINKVYDPACGSGSLLLQVKALGHKIIEEGYFGQEINTVTYNLARMNMFLHNINYTKFDIKKGDTLLNPQHNEYKPFDVIVSNPPYSIKWKGTDDPILINDIRFAPAGVLAPKSRADFAFVLHTLHYLSARGRAAIVCFPGIFYRQGAEKTIRQYLVDNNYVDCIIQLPENLFFGTSIATCILVLAKNKTDNKVLFIDATQEFRKATNNNVLEEENIHTIVEEFTHRTHIAHFSRSVDKAEIEANNYNLSVSSYVEKKDTREKIDIHALNQDIATTVQQINELRAAIDEIVKELGDD